MRTRYWVLIIVAATVLHMWLVFNYLDLDVYPVLSRIAIAFHGVACMGPFWMLADWFIKQHQRKFKTWMWLFLVTWGFLWYYFEIHRTMTRSGETLPLQ